MGFSLTRCSPRSGINRRGSCELCIAKQSRKQRREAMKIYDRDETPHVLVTRTRGEKGAFYDNRDSIRHATCVTNVPSLPPLALCSPTKTMKLFNRWRLSITQPRHHDLTVDNHKAHPSNKRRSSQPQGPRHARGSTLSLANAGTIGINHRDRRDTSKQKMPRNKHMYVWMYCTVQILDLILQTGGGGGGGKKSCHVEFSDHASLKHWQM